MAEGIASLLCHDVATAKKYYVNRGIAAARKTRLCLTKEMQVRTQEPSRPPPEPLDPETNLPGSPTTTTEEETTAASTPEEMPSTTTFAPTDADREAAGPSAAEFVLEHFLEQLHAKKLSPREKFLRIVQKAGPVRLTYDTLKVCLSGSQRKNGRARNMQIYESILATFQDKPQEE